MRRALLPLAVLPALATAQSTPPRADVSTTQQSSTPGLPTTAGGASVGVITREEIAASHAATLSELLQARIAGVSVLRDGGATRDASTVRMRGPRTLVRAASEPILVVDGVRAPSAQRSGTEDPPAGSRLDDVPLATVERIEILRGPAAAARYGPAAAGGAIVVTTRTPAPGGPRLLARLDAAADRVASEFPANYERSSAGALSVWNPLAQASPFRTGSDLRASVTASGSLAGTRLLGIASQRRARGTTSDDASRQLDLAGGIARDLGAATLELRASWARGTAELPDRGSGRSLLVAGMLGMATDDSLHGYGYPLAFLLTPSFADTTERQAVSAALRWQPRPWARVALTAGRTRTSERRASMDRRLPGELRLRTHEAWSDAAGSVSASGELSRAVGGSLRLATAFGAEETTERLEDDVTYGYDHSARAASWLSARVERRDWWIAPHASWRDALVVGASLRRPLGAADARPAGLTSAGADLAWVVRPGAARAPLRLRAAYGRTAHDHVIGSEQYVTGVLGSGQLIIAAPERSDEWEAGLDAPLGPLVRLEATTYVALTRDLTVPWPQPVYGNANAGGVTMRTRGAELRLHASLGDTTRHVAWAGTLVASAMRNRVTSMGSQPLLNLGINVVRDGVPLLGYWGLRVTVRDADGDGLLDPGETTASIENELMGSAIPTREAALLQSLSLPHALRASVQLDYRGGFVGYDQAEVHRCLVGTCRGAHDPGAPLAQRAAASQYARSYAPGDWYFSDASFLRLREVALRWRAPSRVASRVGAGALSVSAAGRDLLLWTPYRGIDPELGRVHATDPRVPFTRVGTALQPLARRLLLRVELAED